MLSTLYSHTEAWPVDPHLSVDSDSGVGSFDNTPAPSNRSSLSITRSVDKTGQHHRSATPVKAGFRHRGHRSSALTCMAGETGDAEKEPLIMLHDKDNLPFISFRRSSTRFKSNMVALGAERQNPQRPNTTAENERSGKRRLKNGIISAHSFGSHLTDSFNFSVRKFLSPKPTPAAGEKLCHSSIQAP